jgi:hypothetical protein
MLDAFGRPAAGDLHRLLHRHLSVEIEEEEREKEHALDAK